MAEYEGMEFISPHKNFKNTSICGEILTEKLTGNWQKDSYTAKTVRKKHM